MKKVSVIIPMYNSEKVKNSEKIYFYALNIY